MPVLLLATLLLATLAHAGSLATAFTDDAGGWSGGTVQAGVLTARDGAVTLAPGTMRSFHLATRVRLAEGTRLWFAAGDQTLAATYGTGGGLTLGAAVAPLPLAEHVWTADATAPLTGGAPDVLRVGGRWLLYREVGAEIHAASSTDGTTWTDLGAVLDGGAPDAGLDGADIVLTYACPAAAAVCRAVSSDGLTFVEDGEVLTGAPTSVTVAPLESGWRLWLDDGGAVGSADSLDGRAWGASTAIADATRLGELDVVAYEGGLAAAWTGAYGIHGTDAGPEADLADAAGDRGPLLAPGFAGWCPDAPATPALALDGTTWHLWVAATGAGASGIGHARGTPTPGAWVGLVVDWDGATLTTTWGAGARLSTPLAAADTLTLGADGLLEVDEALLTYALEGDDTGTTDTGGDTGPSDTGDTGANDTGDTGANDTGDTDTAAADTGDTAPDSPLRNAAELSGESGGCGCAGTGEGAPGALPGLAMLAGLLVLRRAPR